MSDDTKNSAVDGVAVGGVDRFNAETGETTVLSENQGDTPFTLDDYNQTVADAGVEQIKRADMINAQNKVSDNEQKDTGEELPENPGGIQIAMRPKAAVHIMRCQFPSAVITELNTHIENTIIPNNVDHSKGLVGQISQNKRSAQLLSLIHI